MKQKANRTQTQTAKTEQQEEGTKKNKPRNPFQTRLHRTILGLSVERVRSLV